MKTVFLTLVNAPIGGNEHTIVTVRANKNGKRAEIQFIGEKAYVCFQNVKEAYWHLCQTAYKDTPSTYFSVPDEAPDFWTLS